MLKLIAFDFDGTLADSVEFCLSTFDVIFAKYLGDKAPSREEVYQCFGMNEPGVIRHFLGKENPEAEQEFYRIHRQLHPEKCPAPYSGVIDLLDFLKKKGLEMTILTGRSETTCQISMECLNMGHYFSKFQYGSPEKSDKSDHFLKLLKDTGLKREEILYIGDAVSDVTACRKAEITCLSAAWASSARVDELEKINPGLVFYSVEDMKKYLADFLDARG
jgi:phosphoglycolate phosphatase